MPVSTVFLDVDGVIIDHALNPRVWDAHIGEILAPELGGNIADWGRVNREVFPRVWARNEEWGTNPIERIEREAVEGLAAMAESLGLEAPTPARCIELMRRVDVHIAATGEAAFPFAAQAVAALSNLVELHTATGNPSWRVDALLTALGVREHAGLLAGPDLVGVSKLGPNYYTAVFEHAGATAATALVVDDSVRCCEWAMAAGASAAHVRPEPCACAATYHLPSLAEAPALLGARPAALR